MTTQGIGPIKQAVVKALRDNATLKAAVSNEIHESLTPREVGYPYCVYEVLWSARGYDWTSSQIECGVRIWIISDDQVEAHNLDALVIEAMQDKALDLSTSGMFALYCRRVGDASMVDIDDAGKKIYQVGGVFEILADHTL